MQTCLSPWPLLPPRGSTQEGPRCKAWQSGSRALHLCSRLAPNRLCTLVFSDSAVRASPSPALVPPPGRHNQTQSDTITCNQAEQRGGPAWFSVTGTNSVCKDRSAGNDTGSKSKRLMLFSRPSHGSVIPNFLLSLIQASGSLESLREMRKESRQAFSKLCG